MTKPIISFIVLILSVFFAFFYVVPAYDLNQTRRGDVQTLTKILDTSSEIKTLIAKTKTNLSNIDPTGLSRFEVFLPEKIDPIRFANNIQYTGRKNRIALSDIKVEGSVGIATTTPAESGKKFVATKATFTFTSTFEMFQLFLNDLERSLGVINLTSLSFTPLPEATSAKKTKVPPPPTYQYTMSIETYSLK